MKHTRAPGPHNPKQHPTHYNTPGHAHGLTFCCNRHRDYLCDPRACELVLEEVESARAAHALRIWAYVVMPDHVHLLVWPTTRSCSMTRVLNDIKGRAAKRYRDHLFVHAPERARQFLYPERGRQVFRFWQRGGGYDRNIWTARDIHRVMRYIELNPVRAGLVAAPEQYLWSSAYARAHGCGVVADKPGRGGGAGNEI